METSLKARTTLSIAADCKETPIFTFQEHVTLQSLSLTSEFKRRSDDCQTCVCQDSERGILMS